MGSMDKEKINGYVIYAAKSASQLAADICADFGVAAIYGVGNEADSKPMALLIQQYKEAHDQLMAALDAVRTGGKGSSDATE